MNRIKVLLSAVWVLTLSGCMMMGGMGHVQGTGMMGDADPTHHARIHSPVQFTEASNGDLTLALTFPAPSRGAVVPIDVRLRAADARRELTDATIRLQIRRPDGSVDQLSMGRVDSSAAGTFRTPYSFRTAGVYVVTADGRTGQGADVRTVTVSIEVACDSELPGGQHRRPGAAALVGGGSMAVIMALMVGGVH